MLKDVDVQKTFWVGHQHVTDMLCFLAHFIVARELLRATPLPGRTEAFDNHLRTHGNVQFARSFCLQQVLDAMRCTRLCNIDNRFDRGSHRMSTSAPLDPSCPRYCSAALLTLVARVLLKDHAITLDITGPLLTLAAIFGVLTGGMTVCSILEVRLRETASWPAPAWCNLLLTKTADTEMVWGTTAGRPRTTKQCNLALDEDIPINADAPVLEDDAAAVLPSRKLPDTIREVVSEIGAVILKLAQESGNTWATANHIGFRPLKTLGFDKARQLWPLMAAGSIACWSRGKWFAPVPLMPEVGLSTKVLMDRVMELWTDAGCGSSESFMQSYGLVPLMPTVGGAPRMLSVLQGRSALCGSDGLPTRHPPQLLLQTTRDLQKQVRKLDATIVLTWPITENVLCCAMKVLDRINGVTTHAEY
eukprot:s247_g20.t1